MRQILVGLWIVALLAGCGDDDTVLDGGNPGDQCLTDADVVVLSPYYAVDGGVTPEVVDVLYTCGQMMCANELLGNDQELAESCMHDCYQGSIIEGLSPGCEACWTGSVQCAAQNCAVICLGDDMQMCVDCVAEICNPQTNHCTGI